MLGFGEHVMLFFFSKIIKEIVIIKIIINKIKSKNCILSLLHYFIFQIH